MVAGGMLASFDDDLDQMYTTSSTMSNQKARGSNLAANIELQATRAGGVGVSKGTGGIVALVAPDSDEKYTPPNLIYLMSLLSAMGGFLFGYDTGIVSGAMVFVRKYFELNNVWQEMIVSITVLGAWILSIMAGSFSERYGRKVIILLASVIFTFGSIIMGFAWSKWILLFGRLTVGVAIGLASTVVPIYIAEVAPSEIRGSLVTLNNCFITFGQMVAAVTAGIFSSDHESGWRWMLSLAAVPAAIQFGGFMFMPESPRWLVRRRRDQEAMESLKRMRGADSPRLQFEFDMIKRNSNEAETQRARRRQQKRNMIVAVLRKTASRRALIVGCLLMSIQQLAGINTVMYYTATIIEMSGVQSQSMAVWLVVPTSFVYVIFSFAGYILADRVGRRTLTLGSLMGVVVALLVLGTGFHLTSLNSPSVTQFEVSETNGECKTYLDCTGCIANHNCGFCFRPNDLSQSTCLRRDQTNPANPAQSLLGQCSPNNIASDLTQLLSFDPNQVNSYNNTNKLQHQQQSTSSIDINNPLISQVTSTTTSSNSISAADNGGGANSAVREDFKFVTQTGVCPQTNSNGIGLNTWLVVGGLVLYLAAFAPGMGPMPWTINSEIYPMWSRSFCYSMATSINWLFNMIVSFTFLTLTEALTKHGTFYMYSIISSIGWLLLFWKLPETRGRSLEEVSSLFAKHSHNDNDEILSGDNATIGGDNNSFTSAPIGTATSSNSSTSSSSSSTTSTVKRGLSKSQAQITSAGLTQSAQVSPTNWLHHSNSNNNNNNNKSGTRHYHRASTGQLGVAIIGHENLAYDSTDDDQPSKQQQRSGSNNNLTIGQQQQTSPEINVNDLHRRYSHNPIGQRQLEQSAHHYQYLPPPPPPPPAQASAAATALAVTRSNSISNDHIQDSDRM